MDIESYRHSHRIKMDHARIAERRRKLWMGVTAATLVLVLMIGSVVYITFPWESDAPKDFALSEYDAEGNVTGTFVTRKDYYTATTKNLDTFLDKIDVSGEEFATSISNKAELFTRLWNEAKEQKLEGTEETVESTESNVVAPPTVETVETAKADEKCTFYGYDSKGKETSAEYTKKMFSDLVEINYKHWAEKEHIKDSTYVKFVKHFAGRFAEAKSRTVVTVKPKGVANVVTIVENAKVDAAAKSKDTATEAGELKNLEAEAAKNVADAEVGKTVGAEDVNKSKEVTDVLKAVEGSGVMKTVEGDIPVKGKDEDLEELKTAEAIAATKSKDMAKEAEELKNLEAEAVKNVAGAEEALKKAEKALNEASEEDKARLGVEVENAKTVVEINTNEMLEVRNKYAAVLMELGDNIPNEDDSSKGPNALGVPTDKVLPVPGDAVVVAEPSAEGSSAPLVPASGNKDGDETVPNENKVAEGATSPDASNANLAPGTKDGNETASTENKVAEGATSPDASNANLAPGTKDGNETASTENKVAEGATSPDASKTPEPSASGNNEEEDENKKEKALRGLAK